MSSLKWQKKEGWVFDIALVILMLLFSFIMIYPFYNQLVISFNEGKDAERGGLYFLPRILSLQNYEFIFANSKILRGAVISVLRVVVGTITSLAATGLLAYILTIRNFSGRKPLRKLFVVTMYFSAGMIPFYLLILKLGLMNSFTVYWLPNLVNVYYMLLVASYIQELPESLAESARIDGARELTIFRRIIVPTCTPVFAAIAVFTAVGHWNSWFDVMIYNPGGKWDTLTIYLKKILLTIEQIEKLQSEQFANEKYRKLTPETIRAATTMIVTLPIVFSYPFLQRYFIKGITIGAVKG